MALSLDVCSLSSYGIPLQYTMHLLLSARRGGCAFAECPSVSSLHDAMPRLLLRPCQAYSPCPGERGNMLTRGIARTMEPFRRRVTMKKAKRNKAQKRQQALQQRRQQHA